MRTKEELQAARFGRGGDRASLEVRNEAVAVERLLLETGEVAPDPLVTT